MKEQQFFYPLYVIKTRIKRPLDKKHWPSSLQTRSKGILTIGDLMIFVDLTINLNSTAVRVLWPSQPVLAVINYKLGNPGLSHRFGRWSLKLSLYGNLWNDVNSSELHLDKLIRDIVTCAPRAFPVMSIITSVPWYIAFTKITGSIYRRVCDLRIFHPQVVIAA